MKNKKNKPYVIVGLIFLFLVIVRACGKRNDENKQPETDSTTISSSTDNSAAVNDESQDTSEAETTAQVESTISSETSAETTDSEYNAPILIYGGKENDYSEVIIYNAGTSDEVKKTGYFLPPGVYTITNIKDNFVQVNVYSRATKIVDGFEEAEDVSFVKLLKERESVDVTISEGYFLYLADGDNVSAQLK